MNVTKHHAKLICVDFDGVLHAYKSGWQGYDVIPDGPVPGAMKWLRSLIENDSLDVVIHSSRAATSEGIRAMREAIGLWMEEEGYSYDDVSSMVVDLIFTEIKPPAHVTIDDRTIQFRGEFPSVQKIIDFKPWYYK